MDLMTGIDTFLASGDFSFGVFFSFYDVLN